MKTIASILLVLTLAVGNVSSQMKSAPFKEDAWYALIAVHSGKALEIAGGVNGKANGLQLQQNEVTGADNQLFQFKQVEDGFFQITVKHSGKVLEVRDGSLKTETIIQQNDANGKDYQLFTVVKETSGNYRFISRRTGYGFDVLGGVKALGNNIPVGGYPASGATNQTFKVVEAK